MIHLATQSERYNIVEKGNDVNPAIFAIRYHASTQYFFVLRLREEATLMISQGYPTRLDTLDAIDQVRLVASRDDNYRRLASHTGRGYFSLVGRNDAVLASSEVHLAETQLERAIDAVKRYASTARLVG